MQKRSLLTLGFILLLVPGVSAQTISYSDQVNFYHPTISGETGLFTGIVGETLRQGDWSFGIYWNDYDYLLAPAEEVRPPNRRPNTDMDVDDNRLSLSFGYGLTDRWELVASIPYVQIENNAGDLAGFFDGQLHIGKFDESGLGKLHVGTKFGLLDPATTDSRLALSLFVDLGTVADEDLFSDSMDYGLGLHWNSGIWSFGARYKLVGERDSNLCAPGIPLTDPDAIAFCSLATEVDLPNEILVDLGLNVPVGFWPITNWITEVNGIFYNGGDLEPDNPIYLVTGLRHWFGESGWAFNAAVRANIPMWTSDNNSCPIGGLLGLTYAPLRLAAAVPLLPPIPPPAPIIDAPLPPPPPPIVVQPPPAPETIRTDEINFEPGSARLTNIAKAILDDVALRMRENPRATAYVTGYTDDRENTGPNRDLDRRRGQAVRDYLVSRHNIDSSRIVVEGGGVSTVGDNRTAEGRLRNRRVQIRLVIP